MAFAATANAVSWSMKKYRASIELEMAENAKAREEWDELEKSIVANIADEVSIAIRGSEVEMTVHSGGLRTNEENHRSDYLPTVALRHVCFRARGYIFPRCVGGNV